jgi:hypothetical protein
LPLWLSAFGGLFSLSKEKKRFFLSARSCFNGVLPLLLLLLSPEEKDAEPQRQSRVGTGERAHLA